MFKVIYATYAAINVATVADSTTVWQDIDRYHTEISLKQ